MTRNRRTVPWLLAALVGLSFSVHASSSLAQPTRALRLGLPGYIYSDDLRAYELILANAGAVGAVVLAPRSGPFVREELRCAGQPARDPGSTTGPNLSGRRKDDSYRPVLLSEDPRLVIGSDTYLPVLEEQVRMRAQALSRAGIAVYGYVWTNANGADASCVRDEAILAAEIDAYQSIYGIVNVFFDDAAPNCNGNQFAIRTAAIGRVRRNNGRVAVNPGQLVDSCVAAGVDEVVLFEQPASAYLADETARALRANAADVRAVNPSIRVWHLVYGARDPGAVVRVARATDADLLEVTDDGAQPRGCDVGTNPWDGLLGLWPLVRAGREDCTDRTNGSGFTFGELARLVAPDVAPTPLIPPTTTTVTSTTVTIASTTMPTTAPAALRATTTTKLPTAVQKSTKRATKTAPKKALVKRKATARTKG